MKSVKCIEALRVDRYDDNGFYVENENVYIKKNTIWSIDKENNKVIAGEVRLTHEDGIWIEIPKEKLEKCFIEI